MCKWKINKFLYLLSCRYAIVMFTSLTLQDDLVNVEDSLVSVTDFYPAIELPQSLGTITQNHIFLFLCSFLLWDASIMWENAHWPLSLSFIFNLCKLFSCHWLCRGSNTGNIFRSLHRPHWFHYLLEKVCHCRHW